jgi:hypothetical protein
MNPEKPTAHGAGGARLVELEAEERYARYARERYQLYRARAYGSRPTSPGRLRELERRSVLAKRRLDREGRSMSQSPRRTTGIWTERGALHGDQAPGR